MTYYEWLHRCLSEEAKRYTFRIPPGSPLWRLLKRDEIPDKNSKLERSR